jgi:hypothetical protein
MAATTVSGVIQSRATLDDLYRTPGKAELIDGRIVHFMATGHKPAPNNITRPSAQERCLWPLARMNRS